MPIRKHQPKQSPALRTAETDNKEYHPCPLLIARKPGAEPCLKPTMTLRTATTELMGFSGTDGAFEDIHHYIDGEHFTDDEIIVEGRLCGKHVGEFQGIEATGRNVELPFVTFYHFDKTDKLISERVVMNLGALASLRGKVPGRK